MPDAAMLLPARTLLAQLQGLRSLGLDMQAIHAAIGPVPDAPDAVISSEQYLAMWSAARAQYAESGLGSALAMSIPFGAFGPLDYLAGSADSVGGCCRSAIAYFAMLGSDVWLELHPGAEGEHCIQVRAAASMLDEVLEFTLAVLGHRLRFVTENVFVPAKLMLTQRKPARDAIRAKLWQAPIEYGCAYAQMNIDARNWKLSVPRADARLHATLREMADTLKLSNNHASTLESAVRARLRVALGNGNVNPRSMARLLGLSERTLQRRLAEIGRSYSDIVEDFRRAEAERLLRDTDVHLTEIAVRLGYTEHTSFTRAFRRWTGLTPSEWKVAAGRHAPPAR